MHIFMIKRAAAPTRRAPRCTPCCRMALRARALPLGIDEWSAKDDYLQAEAWCHAFRGSTTRTVLFRSRVFFRRFMVLATSKSFLYGSKTIGVVTVDVLVGPACVLVGAVTYSACRCVGTRGSFLRKAKPLPGILSFSSS